MRTISVISERYQMSLEHYKAIFWGKEIKVKLSFIQPGKSTHNAFCESLDGKFRCECLNSLVPICRESPS